ncbi:hypothetical protein CPB83DRAFT_767046 [Crepidotus variabilis]|uniref:DUF6593 domain-containing protein n=1 Tax=Crepidotus variabilis TaxID=179855 RepID=A0A9P6EEY0_9AGAR|nr:hypothetical protein CPB83DRAFT_767046 [Crepidotus variabilis]
MHLYLSSHNPWKTNYCNEDGQIIYKAERGGPTFGARRIMISKIAPSKFNPQATSIDEFALRDEFEHLGEVEYHLIKNSRIKYGGQDQSISKFFRKSGWAFFGRNRIFTGPDGIEYCWKLTSRVSKTPVAVFHRKRVGFIRGARPGSLEIMSEGENMIDIILVTFLYIEKLRKDKERASRSHGGGGP